MSVEIVVPQVGEAISAARLVEWYKKEGDAVRRGEPLFAVDTDKAVLDVEAFEDGVLERILVGEDSEVQPEMVIGLIRKDGAAPPASETPEVSEEKSEPEADAERAPPERPPHRPARKAPRAAVSPRARRLAAELGVDGEALDHKSQGRMITEKDVRAAAGEAKRERGAPTEPGWSGLSPMRRAVAERTQRSKREIPHFYLMSDTDMTEALRLRGSLDPKPSVTVLIAKACACALEAMPEANVRFERNGLLRRETIDIGVTASVGDGVATVVLPEADALSLQEMDKRLKAIRDRLDAGKFRPSDLGERSLTVSNLGMHAVDAFVAVIDPPDPAILSVGAIQDRVVARGGEPAVRPMCALTLSVDHRALDGVAAGRFLNLIRKHLEYPR